MIKWQIETQLSENQMRFQIATAFDASRFFLPIPQKEFFFFFFLLLKRHMERKICALLFFYDYHQGEQNQKLE